MTPDDFRITLHMVASLDGMIAKNDNSVSWFETTSDFEKGVSGEEESEAIKAIDCYVMGSKTYEHAVELSKVYGWVYGDTPAVVVTSRKLSTERASVQFYSGDLHKLVEERLKPNYRNVWVVGGPILVREFLRLGLADEIRMPVLPIILGEGTLFFDHIGQEKLLSLKDVIAYKNGMVELSYEIKKQ